MENKERKSNTSFKDRTGESFISNKGEKFKIIKYIGAKDCDVQFEDGSVVTNICYAAIEKGNVKNPNFPLIYDVGFMGQGVFTLPLSPEHKHIRRVWAGMLRRCYSSEHQKTATTYIGCTVDSHWHNFQVFAKWFEKNYNPETMKGWQLDKYILIKGNKVYSPETCRLVPQEINTLFSFQRSNKPLTGIEKRGIKYRVKIKIDGVNINSHPFDKEGDAFDFYKALKEKEFKKLAVKWKGIIDEDLYEIIYNYQI